MLELIALRSLLFLIIAPGMVAGYIPLALLRNGSQINIGFLTYLAIPLWLIGAIILLWSFWNFLAQGRGTPAPIDPPKELVIIGLYRYVRNPIYVGAMLVLLGTIIWSTSAWMILYSALAYIAFNFLIIVIEEPILKNTFGMAYTEYTQHVPRWTPKFK